MLCHLFIHFIGSNEFYRFCKPLNRVLYLCAVYNPYFFFSNFFLISLFFFFLNAFCVILRLRYNLYEFQWFSFREPNFLFRATNYKKWAHTCCLFDLKLVIISIESVLNKYLPISSIHIHFIILEHLSNSFCCCFWIFFSFPDSFAHDISKYIYYLDMKINVHQYHMCAYKNGVCSIYG